MIILDVDLWLEMFIELLRSYNFGCKLQQSGTEGFLKYLNCLCELWVTSTAAPTVDCVGEWPNHRARLLYLFLSPHAASLPNIPPPPSLSLSSAPLRRFASPFLIDPKNPNFAAQQADQERRDYRINTLCLRLRGSSGLMSHVFYFYVFYWFYLYNWSVICEALTCMKAANLLIDTVECSNIQLRVFLYKPIPCYFWGWSHFREDMYAYVLEFMRLQDMKNQTKEEMIKKNKIKPPYDVWFFGV